MIILGIDPGYGRTGWGVVRVEKRVPHFVACGCITTPAKMSFPDRLITLHTELKSIVKKYEPAVASVEKLFFFNNAKTAMDVGQARGVALLTLYELGVKIVEFTPLQIKQTVSGYGAADKTQVGRMVKLLLTLKEIPKPDDAADALAGAITAATHVRIK